MISHYPNHFCLLMMGAFLVTVSGYSRVVAQDRTTVLGSTTMREKDVRAPELFAERLKLKITLAELPGAGDPKSTWEGSYQIYFVPEADYYSVLDNLSAGAQNLQPAQFSRRVLLAEDSIKKATLGTLNDRTYWRDNIDFRSKIADREKTKFGRILTSYAVKIYDARLKVPIYKSGVFLTYVFERPRDSSGAVSMRDTLYMNFTVTPQGTLSYSQLPRP